MSTIEVIFFIFNVACGLLVAARFGETYGRSGSFVGFAIGFGVGVIFWKVVARVCSLWHLWRPLRPPCKSGACGPDDYTPIEVTPSGTIFQCTCGRKYLRTGRFFMAIRQDGKPEPYMMYDGLFGRWRREDSGTGSVS